MLVLFVVLLWVFLLWFLVGLCHAARVGDRQGRAPESAFSTGESGETAPAAQRQGEPESDGVAIAFSG
jgi:hypothetical protein